MKKRAGLLFEVVEVMLMFHLRSVSKEVYVCAQTTRNLTSGCSHVIEKFIHLPVEPSLFVPTQTFEWTQNKVLTSLNDLTPTST